MSILSKRIKFKLIKLVLTLLILLLYNCNTEQICYDYYGYENINGCYIILSLYYNQTEEQKKDSNFGGVLLLCQSNIDIINKCRKEPSKWPIPNEVVD